MSLIEKIRNGENRFVEFKVDMPAKDQLAKTVVAFANGSGGELFIGIDDKSGIVGLSDKKITDYPDIISDIISDRCYPKIIPDIFRSNIENKAVIIVRVYPGSNKPYYIKSTGLEKGTYIRIGATNKIADKVILQELERQKNNTSYDEETDFNTPVEKFDFKKLSLDMNKLTGKKLKVNDFKNFKLISTYQNKDYLTNASVILGGLTEKTLVKCAMFKGNDMSEFIDRKEFNGMLYDTVDNVIKFIETHIPLSGKIEGLQRKDRYEIPINAVREAVINAVVHRDYTIESDIKVAVFEELVEIISPGILPKSITLDEIKEGRSEIRNKVIARIFKEIKYIEQWGRGISGIIKSCEDYGLKTPEFKEKGGFFSVIIYRKHLRVSGLVADNSGLVADNSGLVADNSGLVADNSGLVADNEKVILEYLKNNKRISTKDAKSVLGLKDAMIRRIFGRMTSSGLILKKGGGRNTYYVENRG
jgi:ATP-dependent DNA helicase RecG